jgi:hypothetical protein
VASLAVMIVCVRYFKRVPVRLWRALGRRRQ